MDPQDFDAAMDDDDGDDSEQDVGARLTALIERIERIEAQMSDLKADRSDVYAEAKAVGFDPKIMRVIVRLRAMDADTREEEAELVELYKKAIGL
jgi:uncharacterized protein (UPF0335 family)